MHLATLVDEERETFWPLTRTIRSPRCRPASSARDVASTRPTRAGQPSTTEKPKPAYWDRSMARWWRSGPAITLFTSGMLVPTGAGRATRLCITGTDGRSLLATRRCFLQPTSSESKWYQPKTGRRPLCRCWRPKDMQPNEWRASVSGGLPQTAISRRRSASSSVISLKQGEVNLYRLCTHDERLHSLQT